MSSKKSLQLFQDGRKEAIAIFESTAQRRWSTAPWKQGQPTQYGITIYGEARSLLWTRVVLATGYCRPAMVFLRDLASYPESLLIF